MILGTKHSEETKQKMRLKALGRYHSEETKQKISEKRRIYTSEEVKKRRNRMTAAEREEVRQIIRKGKEKPCADCGVQYAWWIMQYDHIRGEKKFDLGRAISQTRSKEAVLEEMAKCEVVCANDHANRTYVRRKADPNFGKRNGHKAAQLHVMS